jgi:hypothetical protein
VIFTPLFLGGLVFLADLLNVYLYQATIRKTWCPSPPNGQRSIPTEAINSEVRYQDLHFFCNQLVYGRLVIRRAVEMATLGS